MCNPCLKYKQSVLPIVLTSSPLSLLSLSLSFSLSFSVPKIIWKIYLNAVFRYIDKVCPVKCSKSQQWGFLFCSPCSKCRTTKGHTHTHEARLVYYILTHTHMHRSICIDTQQFHGRPANCAHLLDFNVGHGFYAAFNNAASNPQKSHPPIYNGNANRSPSQVLLLKSS